VNTKVSSKGQVIIPKAVRQSRGWSEGTELIVEERPDGVLLRSKSPFKQTSIDEVIGCAGYKGPPKTLADMEVGIEATRRDRAKKKDKKG
jgi:AbrB family looped-hinge helix DNA binding protein